MQWHISEIKGRNTKRSRRTRVRNRKAAGTLPCLWFSLWFFFILILSTTWFLSLWLTGWNVLTAFLSSWLPTLPGLLYPCVENKWQSLTPNSTYPQEGNFPGGSDGKESACNAGDPGSNPGSERYPGEGNAIHSRIFAWRIPRTEEPSEPQSIGLQRVGHNWATNIFNMKGKLIGTSWVRWPPWSSQPWSRSNTNMANSETRDWAHISNSVLILEIFTPLSQVMFFPPILGTVAFSLVKMEEYTVVWIMCLVDESGHFLLLWSQILHLGRALKPWVGFFWGGECFVSSCCAQALREHSGCSRFDPHMLSHQSAVLTSCPTFYELSDPTQYWQTFFW